MSLNKTFNFLKNHRENDLLMPTQNKNPKYPHKNNSWNWNLVIKHQDEFGNTNNCCILLKSIIVIDIDLASLIDKYEDMFPILKKCPQVATKKGRHYYFSRTSMCDFYKLYDRSRCFGIDNDEIDFKTICSTGTAGVVVIPPSINKKWIKPLWKTPMPDFSGDIFDYFVENWGDNKKKINRVKYLNNVSERLNVSDYNCDFPDKKNIDPKILSTVGDYVENFSMERSTAYCTWIKVCCCLKNISAYYIDESPFFEIWNKFSMKCTFKYKAYETKAIWINYTPRRNNSDINTIKLWAYRDNSKKYVWTDFEPDLKMSIISFIKDFYNYDESLISNSCFYKPDDLYIIVDIEDDLCPHNNDKKHKENCVYIIIGLKNSKKKCRVCESSYWTNRIDNLLYPERMRNELSVPTPKAKNSQKCIMDFYLSAKP